MRILRTVVTLLPVLGLAGPGLAQPVRGPEAVAHQEVGALIDDVTGQLHAWSSRWRGHFTPAPGGPERPLISLMLRHREELELTPGQVQELERLRSEFERDAIRREADVRIAEMDLAVLLRTDPVDLGKVEGKVHEAERLRSDLRLARIRVIEQGKAQLTADQQRRLREVLAGPFRSWAHPERQRLPGPPGGPRGL